jgi:hypothetical protein
MLDDPQSFAAAQPAGMSRRRLQYTLSGLLLLVTLAAFGLAAWVYYIEPYRRQPTTVDLVKRLGGTCQTVESAASWRRMAGATPDITQVNLADCGDPAKYIAAIADLPALELLIVGGAAFDDEHAARLHRLHTLKGLILDSTSVTEDGLMALRAALPHADVYPSRRRAVSSAVAALEPIGYVTTSLSADHPALQELSWADWREREITYVNVADCDDPAKYIDIVVDLPALELLIIGGTAFGDEHAARLYRLRALKGLILDSTSVTADGLTALRAALPQTDIYSSRRRTVARHTTALHQLGSVRTRLSTGHPSLPEFGAGDWQERHITYVNVGDCDDPSKYIAIVADLPALELLIVGGTAFDDKYAARLHHLRTLKGLILDSTSVTENGLAALGDALPQTGIYRSQRRAGARAIAALCKVGDLKTKRQVFPAALEELAEREWLPWEADTFIANAGVNDADLVNLSALGLLHRLYLNGTRVTDAGLAHVSQLSKLQWLDLSRTRVTDKGLAQLKGLTELRDLNLSATQVTNAGLVHLQGLKRLEGLWLSRTHVTAAGVAELRQALPRCFIAK